jgi:hypothetical protein
MDEGLPIGVTEHESVAKRFYSLNSKTGDIYPFVVDDLDSAGLPGLTVKEHPAITRSRELSDETARLLKKYSFSSSLLRSRP